MVFDESLRKKYLKDYYDYELDGNPAWTKKGIDGFLVTRLDRTQFDLNHDILVLDDVGARLVAGSPMVYVDCFDNFRDLVIRVSIDKTNPSVITEDIVEAEGIDLSKEITFIKSNYEVLTNYWNDWERKLSNRELFEML